LLVTKEVTMASRAHGIHDYAHDYWPNGASKRQRRDIQLRSDEPVDLPRSSWWRAGGGFIVAALAVGALVAGSLYNVTYQAPPRLSDTPVTPLLPDYTPSDDVTQAHVVNALSGPLHAVREPAAPGSEVQAASPDEATLPDQATPPVDGAAVPTRKSHHKSSSSTTPVVPYPNPSTTPPDLLPPEDLPGNETPSIDVPPSAEPSPSSDAPHDIGLPPNTESPHNIGLPPSTEAPYPENPYR
jgi:hypothetical protein